MLQISYPRYFPLGQPVQLERVFLDPGRQNCSDRLAGQIACCEQNDFILHFPYATTPQQQLYPFFPGMPFHLHGEYHRLGVRVPVFFEEQLAPGLVRFSASGELQFHYRSGQQRVTADAWHGSQRLSGELLSNLRRWRRQVETSLCKRQQMPLPPFVRRPIAIDEEGVELLIELPAALGDLLLFYLALDDRQPAVTVLAEVVQLEDGETDGLVSAGLHFINILEEDRRRISRLVRELRRSEKGPSWSG